MDEAVGAAGIMPEQYTDFTKLREIATPKELIALTSHSNAAVRCYAFWALVLDEKLKTSVDLFKIVKDHIDDNEFVESQSGCIISSESVADFFISTVEQKDYDLNFYMYELNSNQQKEIDSLLILSKNDSYARQKAIQSLETNDQNYAVLRTLVVEENNSVALPKLAAYKKEEDLQLILDFYKVKTGVNDNERLDAAYLAIQEFPHPAFFSFLKEEQSKTFNEEYFSNEWGSLYEAIARYKNQEAFELLQLPFAKIVYANVRKYHLGFVYDAIGNSPCLLYDDLLWKLWEEENIYTLKTLKYLLDLDPKRAYKNIRKEFEITSEIKNPNLDLDRKKFSDIESREELMLNLVITNEKEIAFEVINNKIKQANVLDFPLYTEYVLKFKTPIFVEPLFERLRTEDNPHVYLKIVKTLFDYEEDTINKEIVKTLSVNKNLTEGWGGVELKEMLLEKKLIKE